MPAWQTALYMLVLGLGLGMTMQVLVLAAQNAVPTTSCSASRPPARRSSARSAARSASRSSARSSPTGSRRTSRPALPPGVRPPAAANPALVQRTCRRAIHEPYVERVRGRAAPGLPRRRGRLVRRLRAHVAAARGAAAQERRRRGRRGELRDAARGRVAARARAHRRHARPPREPLAGLRPARTSASAVDLEPAELWLLARTRRGHGGRPRRPAARRGRATSLRERGLVADGGLAADGEAVYGRVLEARREGLSELLDGWEPEEHDEVQAMLDGLARELVAEPPTAPVTA